MTKDESELDELQKTLIFTLGTLESLVAKGLVFRKGDFEYLSDSGMSIYYALKSEGFSPSDEMTKAAVCLFKSWDGDDDQ